jgi:undecaprenyl-diphosphatase
LNLMHAAILGLVEGITEYLPVSSTGHLIIAASLLGLDHPEDVKRNVDTFDVVIQGGAILAVLGLYWPRVVQMLRGLTGRDRAGLTLFINIVIAFLPAAILGLLLHDRIEQRLFHPIPVLGALAAGGVLMIGIGRWQRSTFPAVASASETSDELGLETMTWKGALIIGMLQCLALWPGTSRSMMSIVGGMLVGLRPRRAAEFSFLLGLPTLGGACAYSAYKNFKGAGPNMIESLGPGALLVGLAVATVSAAVAVRFLVGFLNRHGLAVFGWYRLALCAVIGFMLWRGAVEIKPDAPKAAAPAGASSP